MRIVEVKVSAVLPNERPGGNGVFCLEEGVLAGHTDLGSIGTDERVDEVAWK